MCHCHRGVKSTFTVKHARIQLNPPMTFSQVAAAKTTLLDFNFVKWKTPGKVHLTRFYYFFY